MSKRLAIVIAVIAAALVLLLFVSSYGDPPETLVDASHAERTATETLALIPMPPERFRGDVNAAVHFASPEKVTELCGGKVENKLLLGCATSRPPQMAVPNPCSYPDEIYARILCHEIGHLNLWTEKHEAAAPRCPAPPNLPNPCATVNCNARHMT